MISAPPDDRLPDVVVRVQVVARLIHVAQLDRVAVFHAALVGLLLSGQHAEQRRLARAVRADHADDPAGRQREAEAVDEQPVAIGLRQPLDLDHLLAQARPVRDDDLRLADALLLGLTGHLLIGRDPGLRLRLAGLGAGADPLQFALQGLLARLVLLGLLREALCLLLDPGGVVALPRDAPPALQLQDPAGDVVEEVAVVGDDQDRALVFDQVPLEPGDGLGVEMVRRLVEEEHVGRLQEQLAERHAPPLAAREVGGARIVGRAAERLHRDVDLAVEIPEVLAVDLVLKRRHLVGGLVGIVHRQLVVAVEHGLLVGHAQHDVLAHRHALVERRLLRQVADLGAFRGPGLALEVLVLAGHDPHQGRLAGAVHAHDADLDARQEAQAHVLEHLLAAGIGLRDAVHMIDVLIARHGPVLARIWGSAVPYRGRGGGATGAGTGLRLVARPVLMARCGAAFQGRGPGRRSGFWAGPSIRPMPAMSTSRARR